MKTYRVDNRKKEIGEILVPQNKYQSGLSTDKKNVEDILEKYRPKDKPQRNSILMLFWDFKDALTHWTKQQNAIFYRTTIDEKAILHKGDFKITEQIYAAIKQGDIEKAEILAKEYWDGKLDNNPIIEIFVTDAMVDKIISDSEVERKHELKLRHSIAFGDFKPDPRIKRVTDED